YGWGAYIGGGGKTADHTLQETYNQIYRKQLEEVFSYQDVYGLRYKEIWFDGSCGVAIGDLIDKHAESAVIFQSPQATIRWCGTESGKVNDPAWSSLDSRYLKMGIATAYHSDPDGDAWAPIEVDTTLYNHNWFWSKANEKKRKTLEELMAFYYQSVGRGAVALLNASPTCTGAISEEDVKRYAEFGAEIERRFAHPLGRMTHQSDGAIIIFDQPTWINHVVVMEDYREGENIRQYTLEGLKDGIWHEIATGSMIGRKKIQVFEDIEVDQLRFKVLVSCQEPRIRAFEAYHVEGVAIASLVSCLNDTVAIHGQSGVCCLEWADKGWGDWQELYIDLSQQVKVPGQYEIKFEAEALEIKDEMGILEGYETPHILTKIDANTYHINRTSVITGDEITAMTCKVRCKAGKSQGRVMISPR
ncbi:MAG: alpha-L-fucosidase, partial [Cellulosilyticaceae bacterium]